MAHELINPKSLGAPHGYSNGVIVDAGCRLLFIAGQVGWNEQQEIVSHDFVEQFELALTNVVAVVNEAGGEPADICRLIIYVTDRDEYTSRTREVGERYRKHMGKHFPAMLLIEVKGLLEDFAKVEIEGVAALKSL